MRRLASLLLALVLGLATATLLAPPANAAGPFCGIYWGSLPKSSGFPGDMSTDPITNVRTGRHACYDRLVVDIKGPDVGGYRVEYVNELIGTAGEPVSLRGGSKLSITLVNPAYDDSGSATFDPADPDEVRDVTGYRTFRQVKYVESFEGVTLFGLGVRGRLPFRVFTLAGPGGGSRLVLDVAHRW